MEGRWQVYLCGGCNRPAFGVGGDQHCTDTDRMEPQQPVPVVPCNDAAIERVATKLAEIQGYHAGPLEIDRRSARDLLRAAAGTAERV